MSHQTFRVAVGPHDHSADGDAVQDLIRGAGAEPCPLSELDRADALLWTRSGTAGFPDHLPDSVRWVQLPSAGIEAWLAAGVLDGARTWTTATGAYAPQVAEHVVALLLAGLRDLPAAARATSWVKDELSERGRTLRGARVGVYGAGGIGRALIPMLTGLGARTVAVNRSGRPVEGAEETLAASAAEGVWGAVDHMVIAAPATAETQHLVGARELAAMREDAWLVNVARGSLVDQEALREALDSGRIAGAALDVTDPEPLPDGHWMFSHPRIVLTPHVANPRRCLEASLTERMADNLRRYVAGEELVGVVDLDRGY